MKFLDTALNGKGKYTGLSLRWGIKQPVNRMVRGFRSLLNL